MKVIEKTNLKDGHYTVKNGYVVERGDPSNAGTWFARIIVWAFAIYLVLATANCAVQEGVKMYQTVATAAK